MTYEEGIELAATKIDEAEAIIVGAGAGLSAAAGFVYDGPLFHENFADFEDKYGIRDLYSGGFYPFETTEEFWAWWSRHIYLTRYKDEKAGDPYLDLEKILHGRNYFVLTTNVDHQFQKAHFDKKRLFYTQGDYGLFQCSVPCTPVTYDNEEAVRAMYSEQKDMKIPTELLPVCPNCGAPMTTNLRIDNTFVEDAGWKAAAKRYEKFLNASERKNEVFFELGVGNNTPGIIKYPFWRMCMDNPKSFYIAVSNEDSMVPGQILGRSLGIRADAKKALKDILTVLRAK